jgi:hypothetical protein
VEWLQNGTYTFETQRPPLAESQRPSGPSSSERAFANARATILLALILV